MRSLVPRQPMYTVEPDRGLNAEVAAAERVGIGAVARVQAGAFVTSVAMQNATMLSRAANAAFKVSPMGEEVYQALFNAYGTLAVSEIQSLSFHGRA
jgi:hypothetical protein